MIYLDNAATSWPKPPEVAAEVNRMLTEFGGSAGRGGHEFSLQAARRIFWTRQRLAELVGLNDPSSVVFTANATQALNEALFGLLKPGDHVIASSVEHNAVARPLRVLTRRGVEVSWIPAIGEDWFSLEEYRRSFRPNTRLVVTVHASNVTGALLPVEEIGVIAREHGVPYLLDASQTAGVFDLAALPADLIAFPGHKALLGPQGTGVLVIRNKISLQPIIVGGTGSMSESDEQPDFLPDALESGTQNGPGIAGLGRGVAFIQSQGMVTLREKEQALCQRLLDGLSEIPKVLVYGGLDARKKAPVVAFNIGDADSMLVGHILDTAYGIISRAGLHCAPYAHRVLGTLDRGVVRFSPSHFTTVEEVDQAVGAVAEIASQV